MMMNEKTEGWKWSRGRELKQNELSEMERESDEWEEEEELVEYRESEGVKKRE